METIDIDQDHKSWRILKKWYKSASNMNLIASIISSLLVLNFARANPIKSEDGEFYFPEQNCVHKFPVVDDVPHPVFLEHSPGHRSKRSMEHQLRIRVFYHESVEKLKKRERSIVKDQVRKYAFEVIELFL